MQFDETSVFVFIVLDNPKVNLQVWTQRRENLHATFDWGALRVPGLCLLTRQLQYVEGEQSCCSLLPSNEHMYIWGVFLSPRFCSYALHQISKHNTNGSMWRRWHMAFRTIHGKWAELMQPAPIRCAHVLFGKQSVRMHWFESPAPESNTRCPRRHVACARANVFTTSSGETPSCLWLTETSFDLCIASARHAQAGRSQVDTQRLHTQLLGEAITYGFGETRPEKNRCAPLTRCRHTYWAFCVSHMRLFSLWSYQGPTSMQLGTWCIVALSCSGHCLCEMDECIVRYAMSKLLYKKS